MIRVKIAADESKEATLAHHTDPLSIALLCLAKSWRGGETQLLALARRLVEAGCGVRVLARGDATPAHRFAEAGLAVTPLVSGPQGPMRMRRALAELRPDVLHANDSRAASWLLAAAGLPIRMRVASRRVAFPIRSPWKYQLGADMVFAVSQTVARQCVAAGVAEDRVRVVYDGCEIPPTSGFDRRLVRRGIGVSENAEMLLCTSALTEEKGHEHLLASLALLASSRPRLVAVLAGEGPLKRRLMRRAFELGVADRVRFLGFRNQVAPLLAAADLAVIPSISEGLCTSAIEAMAVGVPLAASRIDGLVEAVSGDADQMLAWLAEPENPRSLADTISAALDDPRQRSERAALASAWVGTRFTADRMAASTLEGYREFLDRGVSLIPRPVVAA